MSEQLSSKAVDCLIQVVSNTGLTVHHYHRAFFSYLDRRGTRVFSECCQGLLVDCIGV